jgi:hypothetical protein
MKGSSLHRAFLAGHCKSITYDYLYDILKEVEGFSRLDIPTKIWKGYAFVEFTNGTSLAHFIQRDSIPIRGGKLFIKAHKKGSTLKKTKLEVDARRVYVRSIPPDWRNEDLSAIMARFGGVETAYIIREKNQRIKNNYGYVLFKHVEDARRAVKREKVNFPGGCLVLKQSRTQSQRKRVKKTDGRDKRMRVRENREEIIQQGKRRRPEFGRVSQESSYRVRNKGWKHHQFEDERNDHYDPNPLSHRPGHYDHHYLDELPTLDSVHQELYQNQNRNRNAENPRSRTFLTRQQNLTSIEMIEQKNHNKKFKKLNEVQSGRYRRPHQNQKATAEADFHSLKPSNSFYYKFRKANSKREVTQTRRQREKIIFENLWPYLNELNFEYTTHQRNKKNMELNYFMPNNYPKANKMRLDFDSLNVFSKNDWNDNSEHHEAEENDWSF